MSAVIRRSRKIRPRARKKSCAGLPAPALAPLQADQLEAHIGRYERVAQSVFVYGRSEMDAWAHKKNEFDYTVGPGLALLYPGFKGRLHVHLLNAQHINAFALPNGSVYVNAGLIARFQNEARLATVMAHEGAHFTHRYSLQQAEQAKNASAFALVVAMLGVPLVGDLVAFSSMFGYSQEHEHHADEIGYQWLATGYDPRESVRTFEQLLAEIRATADIQEPFFCQSPQAAGTHRPLQ
jgi:hypothetical protein